MKERISKIDVFFFIALCLIGIGSIILFAGLYESSNNENIELKYKIVELGYGEYVIENGKRYFRWKTK